MRGGRCVSHVRSAREQYRNLSSWTRLSLDHEIEVGAGGASRFDIKSTRGGAVVTPSLRRMTSVSNNSSEISRKKSVPRDMASFAENPDGGGFVSTLRRKKQTDTHKKITRNSTSPSHAKLELQKSNHSRTSVSPTRNKIEPTINIMHQTTHRQQPQRQMSAIVNYNHTRSDIGHRISESSSSRTPSMPTTPTSPFPGSHTTSPWATPKYTQTYTYERQERLSAPRERFHSNSVPTRKISVQTDDGLLSDKNVIEDAQPELDKNPEVRENQRKVIAAPSVRRAKSSIDNETKQLQEARKKRRNTVFIRSTLGMDLIKKVDLEEVYDVFKQLGTGRFGYVQLAEHKQSKLKIALKFFPRPQIKQADFVREYNYSYFLSPHPNIIDTYEGMYQTHDESAFFFVQEFCPSASLREAVERSPGGLTEDVTRVIFTKVLSAMEFMHNENLVHRNLKAENILIFDIERYTRVKITDFGLTRKVDSTVKYLEYVNCYHAPELCETVVNEVLTVNKSLDIWSLGIIFYYCLKGKFPWQKASIMCKPYWEWEQWLKRKSPQLPKRWDPFSEKSLKLLKRCLHPKAKDRWTVKEMRKIITKERLLKEAKVKPFVSKAKHTFSFDDHFVYLDEENTVKNYGTIPKITKKKSALGNWINNTWATMSEISEQVVSAQD